MANQSPHFERLKEAFGRIEKVLSVFPEDYQRQLPVSRMAKVLEKERSAEGPTHLLFSVGSILPFILQEENTGADEKALLDYTSLLLFVYCSYALFDGILDENQGVLLPAALILFRDALFLGKEIGMEISDSLNTVEIYNVSPNSVPVGRVDMRRVSSLDENWHRLQDGFSIAPAIVEHFVASHIGKTHRDWAAFFNEYLIYRQLLDDCNGFVKDYGNGELRSLGIAALMKCFPNREKVHLKNPLTAFRFQLFVLRNLKTLYEGLMNRFYERLARKGMAKQEFLNLLKKLEKFLYVYIIE